MQNVVDVTEGLAQRSDAELVHTVASIISVPRVDVANSFVLHAPLELAARSALLPYVVEEQRIDARKQIARIAGQYVGFGAGIDDAGKPGGGPYPETSTRVDFDDVCAATSSLVSAIAAADLEGADHAAVWLSANLNPEMLRSCLADVVAPSLAAAAHGSIFLYLLPRVAPRGEQLTAMIRPLVRELARYPELRLNWQHDIVKPSGPNTTVGDGLALEAALASVPQLGIPGSDFIFPVMHQVESSGVASDVLTNALAGTPLREATVVILRTAAASMLGESDQYAPYGWSHCLTMPQGVLGIAHDSCDSAQLIAIAATYVVGFRAAFGQCDPDTGYAPIDPGVRLRDALAAGADRATTAAAAAHDYRDDPLVVRTLLATAASTQEDAHLVKYVLASFDAAATDPVCGPMYMAAAASLCSYWHGVYGARSSG